MAKRQTPPLQKVNRRVLRMNKLVCTAVEDAVRSLAEQNEKLANQVVAGDDTIDTQEVAIEQECLDLLMRPEHLQPEQLRYVLCLIKINSDLERVADCAVNISERVPRFVRREAPPLPDDLKILANSAFGMLRDAVTAWVAGDVDLAKRVMRTDDVVDAHYNKLADDVTGRIEREPASGHYLEYLLAARDFERIADHATNIAECVIHISTGKIVRHQKIELD